MLRRLIALLLLALPASVALAGPQNYLLEADKSKVGFIYRLSGSDSSGTMPISSAIIEIDTDALTRSSVDVSVDVTRERAGLIFATEALKAGSVLDAQNHPEIRFRSTAIRLGGQGRLSDGATIDGLLTIRGVTKPVTLNAALYRQRGTQASDLSQLSFQISGELSRSEFGASGFADLVADKVRLNIVARLRRK